ncbi:MAG: dimethyladenosine transferase [Gammaproteobacteria bacterium]|jgi:16S rRNA (adenine1518-N6/adenine1519-N6)-dimethyltransferase|nr:dimethyladenosine transferase [Gammaproteobacteria bacterium]
MTASSTHRPKKHLGQHFLTDEAVIQRIVHAISPNKAQHLVEIGPGLGALTKRLLPLVDEMDAVEFDKDVFPKLTQACQLLGTLHLHLDDALQFNFSSLYQNDQPLRVVGNLPYQISTPLLFHLIQYADIISDAHFMLQKEVVDRMAAEVGTKAYGRLSVMTQYHFHVESLFIVGREAFHPMPKVTSAVVRLIPKKINAPAKDYQQFSQIVKQAFNYRRKTLRNALKEIVGEEQIALAGLDPAVRPEELSVEAFVEISNLVSVDGH